MSPLTNKKSMLWLRGLHGQKPCGMRAVGRSRIWWGWMLNSLSTALVRGEGMPVFIGKEGSFKLLPILHLDFQSLALCPYTFRSKNLSTVCVCVGGVLLPFIIFISSQKSRGYRRRTGFMLKVESVENTLNIIDIYTQQGQSRILIIIVFCRKRKTQ